LETKKLLLELGWFGVLSALELDPFGIVIAVPFLDKLHLCQPLQYANHRPLMYDPIVLQPINQPLLLDNMSSELILSIRPSHFQAVKHIHIPVKFQRRTLSLARLDPYRRHILRQSAVNNLQQQLLVLRPVHSIAPVKIPTTVCCKHDNPTRLHPGLGQLPRYRWRLHLVPELEDLALALGSFGDMFHALYCATDHLVLGVFHYLQFYLLVGEAVGEQGGGAGRV